MLNPTWQAFLEQHGAHIQDGDIQDFGDASTERIATRDNTILCALSQFGTLKISGEDAQTFLQSLLSSDIKALTPQLAQFSSFNTAKGRVLASFLVYRISDEYFLHLPAALLAPLQKKLGMYVLRSKVKIEDASTQQACIGIAGKEATALLQTHLGAATPGALTLTRHGDADILRLADDRFQIHTTPEHAANLWAKLSPHARPVGSSCWDWLNIRAGIPVVLPATQEQSVLLMLNLDILGGVSFKKGCYPGQEIVARVHHQGKLKQRTYLAHIGGTVAPQANDALYSDDYAGQSSGNILNAAPAPEGGYDVLATLHISSVKEGRSVHWQTADGATLGFRELPYRFPAESGG